MNRIMVLMAVILLVGVWHGDGIAAGGTVSGKITYEGDPPPPEHFMVMKNPEFCGEERDFFHVRVKNGILQDAAVLIEGVKGGKPFGGGQTTSMVGRDCAFLPFTRVAEKLGKGKKNAPILKVVNEDEVIHNPHPFEVVGPVRRSLWNLGLPQKGSKLTKELRVRRGNVVKLQCDQHDFMHAWIRIVTNPYWTMAGKDGSFKIDEIPPGKYTLVAWHPILGEQKKEITVGDGGTVDASFTFSGAGRGR